MRNIKACGLRVGWKIFNHEWARMGRGRATTGLVFFCLRRGAATPDEGGGVLWDAGGVARASLNPRPMAGIPRGWGMLGGVVSGVAGVAGLSEPGYNGGRAQGRWLEGGGRAI